jgi:hypothetical protein
VDSVALFIVLVMALALMLAGAYGVAPMLIGRRQVHAHGGDAASLFALSNAFPLLRQDLAEAVAAAPAKATIRTPARHREEDDAEETLPALEGDPGAQEEVLTDLFAEIGMLRLQIEGLRRELGGLALDAAPAARRQPPAQAEPRRRAKAMPAPDLPPSLRKRVGDVRRRRSLQRD